MTRKLFAISTALALLGGCGGEGDSPTQRALEELQSKYDELARDRIEEPVQWASDDIENIGDWEYKVVDLSTIDASDLETELNALGDERWEIVWVDVVAGKRVAIFKRPAVSWLSKLPLSALGRMFIGGGGDPQ